MATLSADVLENYRNWLHWYVRFTYASLPPDWKDLAQEGWIAMWRALRTFDASKGALPSYLTKAAKMRIADVVRRQTWTGTLGARGHIREKPATPVDTDWDWVDQATTKMSSADAFAEVEYAYHHGEILAALDSLPYNEKRWVVVNILYDGGRYSWRDAARRMKPSTKDHLAERLIHLKEGA